MTTARMGLHVERDALARPLRLHEEGTRCGACAQPMGVWGTDRLTGLLDRWGWDDQAPAAFRRAQRRWESVALLMIDLDRFKKINDEYGHPAGDVVLRHVSEVLVTSTRAGDLVCRYGGDEFLVLLPRATAGEASAVAERVLRGIQALRVEVTTNDGYGLTLRDLAVSIGVAACVPDSATSLIDLVRDTDAALQRAKRNGRGCVHVHDAHPASERRGLDGTALRNLVVLQKLMSNDVMPHVLVALSGGPKAHGDLVSAIGSSVDHALQLLHDTGFVRRFEEWYELSSAAQEWISDVVPAMRRFS